MTDRDQLQRTITLTDRPPIIIKEGEWPIIARGLAPSGSGARFIKRSIRVRRHVDGRAIIYGVFTFETRFADEHRSTANRGVLLPAPTTTQDVASAVFVVADQLRQAEELVIPTTLRERNPRLAELSDPRFWTTACQQCLALLPAEVLK